MASELVFQMAVLVHRALVVEFPRCYRPMSRLEYVQFLESQPDQLQKMRDVVNAAANDTFWQDDDNPDVQVFWLSAPERLENN